MNKFTKTELSEIKRWIADLRSGEFKQGTRKLQSSKGSFCCLGVLCTRFDYRKVDGLLAGAYTCVNYGAPNWALPVQKLIADSTGENLTSYNDAYCWTFKEIATLVELCLEEDGEKILEHLVITGAKK